VTIRIAMWSGPRNLSTAMMRSFGSRSDTFVSDEPFYGAYLQATGDPQPMAGQVMASIWYQKHMAHHMVGPIGLDDLPGMTHAFLIRDPARVVASYAAKRVAVRPDHLGVERQVEYFERESDRLGRAPPVVDSADILANPAGVLGRLCEALGIAWDPAMLHWEAGMRETDGIWASHWYDTVAASTGFGSPDRGSIELDGEARRVADACRPFYERLAKHRITA